ncbi:MAG: hypothetical protein F4X81_09255 [Gammaproteobacteria bacterium]|nr:hypothetical protein [Gammaproteobacteria bacterium]
MRHREHLIPFFAFSAPIRRAIYTTNAVESLNSTVRRAVRSKGHAKSIQPSHDPCAEFTTISLVRPSA